MNGALKARINQVRKNTKKGKTLKLKRSRKTPKI